MKPIDIWRAAGRAQALSGHPRWRQLAEIGLLRLSQGKLQPEEYFNYRLYRRDLPLDQKQAYIGYWRWDAVYEHNCPRDAAIADSKIASYDLFAREGVPHPKVRAVINDTGTHAAYEQLNDVAEIAEFFRRAPGPLFLKPDSGSHGLGAMIVDRLDPDGLRLRDGSTVALDVLAASPIPIIVQDLIEPHADLRRMTGGTAPTARVFLLVDEGRATVHCAVLRVPVGRAMVDNFHAGRTGNLIVEIDVASGTCGTAVAGLGFDHRLVDRHPDTGEPIRGARIPGWSDACWTLQQAAHLFPGLSIQAWDIAFTPTGPVVIEVNSKGEFRILQHALQRGIIDERFRRVARLRRTLAA